jgi:hypothetical protein
VGPPAVVKAPPTRPKDIVAEKKVEVVTVPVPPPPSSVMEKKMDEDDDDGPPPPPPVESPTKAPAPDIPAKSPVRPKKMGSGGDDDDQAIEIAELKRKLANAEAKLVRLQMTV